MRIFLSAPFTEEINPATQLVQDDFRAWLVRVIGFLESKGHQVTNAHLREDWGKRLESPDVALKLDYAAIQAVDTVVAVLGNPPSPGVQMELGFAACFKKRLLVAAPAGLELPYLVQGLHALTTTTLMSFSDLDGLLSALDAHL
jgi:hypothetical protein